ncbi:MAG: DinB family protein [Chloroflexales bacterium]
MTHADVHGDASVVTTLFAHNTWANLKLLEFCAQVSDAALDATAIGGYGSIRATLVHILRAEVSYVERVNGKRPPHALTGDPLPGFAALQDVARWAGDELLQLARSARKDTIVREREQGLVCAYPLASLIVQEVTHATEHRTQIATIITQLGLEPPDLSTWQYMVETGEFREWAEGEADA